MHNVTITTGNGKLSVVSPYNTDFVEGAKKLAGVWNAATSAWTFDPRNEARVRDLCWNVYGNDGVTKDTCTLRIDLSLYMPSWNGPLMLGGREIVRRPLRNKQRGRLGDEILLISGAIEPHWKGAQVGPDGAVVVVHDFPLTKALQVMQEYPGAFAIEQPCASNRSKLAAERERVAARLAEIDARLAELQTQEASQP